MDEPVDDGPGAEDPAGALVVDRPADRAARQHRVRHLTDAGRATRARIEALTDALAEAPFERLEASELDELVAVLEPISSRLAATGSE